VAVLGFLLLLSYVTLAFVEEAVEKIRYFGLFYNREDLRAVAYSALETSFAVVNQIGEIDHKLVGPVQGWSNPLQSASVQFPEGYRVEVSFEDESGKIPLAKADESLLRQYFDTLEIPFDRQGMLIDTLKDWTDEDDLAALNGYDGDDYESRDPPYQPPNERIQTWEELELIEGWKEVFWDEETGLPLPRLETFKNSFSLYHDGKININSAPPKVLETLALLYGFQPENIRYYQSGEDATLGTEDDRLMLDGSSGLIPENSELIGFETQLIKVKVNVTYGEANFLLTVLASWKGGANPGANPDNRKRTQKGERGTTAQTEDRGAALGYPFDILRLTENYKF